MKNLAGVRAEISDPIVRAELEQAQVPIRSVRFSSGHQPEVPTTLIGHLTFVDGWQVVFRRGWYYWMVKMNWMLPCSIAEKLNAEHGGEVRAYGFAGGIQIEPEGCDHWHVDTQAGLNVLVSVLKDSLGQVSAYRPTIEDLVRCDLLNRDYFD